MATETGTTRSGRTVSWPTSSAVPRGWRRAPGTWIRYWDLALIVASAVAITTLGYRRRWLDDDGLIFTRTVREILAGHGPVFSPGERAEASTSTLWQWLLALGSWLTGADPARLAVFGGLGLTALGFVLAMQATQRLYHEQAGQLGAQPLLPAGVLVLLALPPVWDFATSGLETGLSTCWLALGWQLLVRTRPGQSRLGVGRTGFVLGLAPLVRPDLLIVGVAFLAGVWLLAGRPGWRRTGLGLGAALAVPVAYEIFRMGYYGLLLPLPALTKEAGASDWGRGWTYVGGFVGRFGLPFALPVLAVIAVIVVAMVRRGAGHSAEHHRSAEPHRLPVLIGVPMATGALLTIYVAKVGGDWMQARLLLPALLVVALPVLVVPATRLTGCCCLLLVAWAVGLLGISRAGQTRIADLPTVPRPGLPAIDVRAGAIRLTGLEHPDRPQDLAAAFPTYVTAVQAAVAENRPVLLLYASGYGDDRLYAVPLAGDQGQRPVVVGSYLGAAGETVPLDLRVVDQFSLAYPLGAHLTLQRWIWPGHEKLISNAWILADYGTDGVLPGGPPAADVSLPSIAAARHVLTCGDVRELQDSVRQPLTLGRFWRNLIGAPRRTALRIPRDPFAAERKFCRGGG